MAMTLLQQAAQYLKKALPLMLKHQIPTTPVNYALWYAYVSERNPALNASLDEAVSQYNTCPPSTAELLYRHHLAPEDELDVRDMRQSMEAIATELSQSLKDTSCDADSFRAKIERNFGRISRLDQDAMDLEQVMGMVRALVKDSDDIRSNTDYLSSQLSKAQQEIDSLRLQLQNTEKDILFDALTGCLNRRAFDADFDSLLSQSPKGCCLILVDVDHFKRFNDEYGHLLGDQVLKAVAKRLQDSCRDGTKLYRFGGEEFAILVPTSQLRVARQLAEAMRRALEKVSVRDRRKGQLISNISASFGVAEWQQLDTRQSLTERADTLLYDAKRLGRNRVMPISG